jgi:hypothetical protein
MTTMMQWAMGATVMLAALAFIAALASLGGGFEELPVAKWGRW